MGLNFPKLHGRSIITLNQFLNNPTGKGSSMMGKRAEIKKNLEVRYRKLISTYGNFNYKIYKDGYNYLFCFKIPSETYPDLYYDAILEFVPDDKKYRDFSTIMDYSINFFSNSPHMMFTYTYVLRMEGLLIQSLKNIKYSKTALTQRPKITNPVEMFGFEKTCYYAAMFISEHHLYEKANINQVVIEIDRNIRLNFFNSISSQENKLKEYNLRKNAEKLKKQKASSNRVKKANSQYLKQVEARNKRLKKSSGFKPLIRK